jgi:hypothetical protein
MPWDTPVADPVAALAEARRSLGDTFVVESGDDCYLFTFSAVGVKSFYALPEDRASKGVADWRMLRRKLPDEMFAGRRILPHQLFGREDVATYLQNVQTALDDTLAELGPEGDVEVFELTRRLGHRVGLASWGGPGSAKGRRFDRLARAFDALDGSESFVHPDAMAHVAATAKAAEYEALAVITGELGDALPPGATWRPASPSPPCSRSPTRVPHLASRNGIRASGTAVGWPIHRSSLRWSWSRHSVMAATRVRPSRFHCQR